MSNLEQFALTHFADENWTAFHDTREFRRVAIPAMYIGTALFAFVLGLL